MMPYADDFSTEDDYVVVRVEIHEKGQIRVRSFGPYTKAHAERVRRAYTATSPRVGWRHHYSVTRMGREDERLQVA